MPLVRGRPSAATTQASPSTTSPVQSRSRQLPPYEPPSHPLTPAAQRSLASLPSTSTANSNSTSIPSKLKNHFKAASEALGEVTDNINELATVQRRKAERQKQRARGKPTSSGAGEDEENEEPMDEDGGGGGAEASAVGKKVDVLTAEIEEKVRDLIDLQARMDAREKSLKEAIAMTEQGGGSSTTFGRGTQSTLGASQFRKQLPGEFAEADEENDDAEQEGSNGTIDGYAGPGVPTLIGNRMRDWEQKYGAMGMREKYANHNDYISFKSSLHYAQHAGEDPPPPVPHSSTWFRSSSSGPGGSQPTLNRHESGSADDEDPDSDLEAVTANINIKCPITLLPMRNPVRSTKCPHNFERDAIEDMIRRSPTRVGGSGRRGINDGIQAVGCPVCSTPLTTADLAPDPVLRRNIQRIQAAEQARDGDEDDEEDDPLRDGHTSRRHPQNITSSPYQGRFSGGPQVKAEIVKSSMARGSVVPSTQLDDTAPPMSTAEIVDLGGDDSEEEEDTD